MLYLCCGAMYAISIIESLANMSISNSYSNSRIMEMGYEIKSMKNISLVKNIKYFLKAYGWSFIPVYNLFYSIMIDSESHSDSDSARREYDNKRINMLLDSGLIIKTKEKISSSKKVKSKKVESIKKETMTKIKTSSEMNCYERRDFYKTEYEKSCRECELESLKAERNFLLSSMDESIKLMRK